MLDPRSLNYFYLRNAISVFFICPFGKSYQLFITTIIYYLIFLLGIIVTGGISLDSKNWAELLYSNGSFWCTLPDLPKRWGSHTQNGPTACNGDSCYTLGVSGWAKSSNNNHRGGKFTCFSSL